MKLFRNKHSQILLILPILGFVFVVAYYFFSAYVNYNAVNGSIIYGKYIEKLNNMLNENAKEKELVSVFSGTNGLSDFKQVENQWQIVDKSRDDLKTFSSKHSDYKDRAEEILNRLASMKEIRPNISILSIDYEKLYMSESSIRVDEAIVQDISSVDAELDAELKKKLDIYIAILKLKDATMSEKAFVSYLLSRSSAISIDELEIWDRYIAKDGVTNYDELTKKFTSLELDTFLKSTKHKEILQQINTQRKSILSSMGNGDFTTDLSTWYELFNAKISALEQAQSKIKESIEEGFVLKIEAEKKVMSITAILILLSIFLTFIIRNIFSSIDRDREELGKVLQNIEIDYGDDEFDIKGMIDRQDKTEMYEFLEKTIRESKESKRLSDEANESKSQFLANMSHEIRTPLNGIVGFTDLLKETNMDEEQREFIEVIEKSSENLLAVINDILDLSKIESNKIDIEEVPFDPIVEFESGIESYGAKASEKGINFGFYIDPSLSNQLRGDAVRIKQIIVNLISNAVKFTPDGGEIDVLIEKVATRGDKATVRFSVKDSGIGITQEQQGKIFEAFSQADTSTNRKFGGTGLGLTISKTFVELMGGKLKLESELGDGTTFYFELTFEEIVSNRGADNFSELNIGYYLPGLKIMKQSDKYVKEYINSLSKFYHLYDCFDALANLGIEDKPELLFIDYAYIKTEELVELNKTGINIVLLTTLDKKDQISDLELDLHKVIYSPINFTKIKKTMQTYSDTNVEGLSKDEALKKHQASAAHNTSRSSSSNLLLCRSSESDLNIYKTLLVKLGYSVDTAKDIAEVEDMVKARNYEYVLLDSNIVGLGESGLAQMLDEMSVKTLLFIENKRSIGEITRKSYTNIAIDIPQLQLLKHTMSKLMPIR